MKIHHTIPLFCVVLLPYTSFGASIPNMTVPVPISIGAASYNNPSDNNVWCNEYSNGYCYLYVYVNRTHPRFQPLSSNAESIKTVSLSGQVFVLGEDICSAFPNVEYLDLSYARIEEILPGALDKCKNVRNINLNNNNIRVLPRDTFRYNLQVKYLNMQRCHLKKLETWLFTSLFSLTELNLDGNFLTEFSSDLVKTNKNLTYLNLSANDLLDIDEVKLLEYLPNLKSLALSNNQLSCDRIQQIKSNLDGSNAYLANYYNYDIRKRFYLQDSVDNFLCLPIDTWLNVYNQQKALKKGDSTYQISVGGSRNDWNH